MDGLHSLLDFLFDSPCLLLSSSAIPDELLLKLFNIIL